MIEVRVYKLDFYLAVSLTEEGREFVVRRFPWPNRVDLRKKFLRYSVDYGGRLSQFLNYKLVVAVPVGALTEGLPPDNSETRRAAQRLERHEAAGPKTDT